MKTEHTFLLVNLENACDEINRSEDLTLDRKKEITELIQQGVKLARFQDKRLKRHNLVLSGMSFALFLSTCFYIVTMDNTVKFVHAVEDSYRSKVNYLGNNLKDCIDQAKAKKITKGVH